MSPENPSRRPENLGALLVAALCGLGVFLVLVFIGTGFVVSIAFALLALLVLGGGHYLIWGRAMQRQPIRRRPPGEGLR